MSKEAMKLATEFNRYFTSMNGVDVPERVLVSRDEWRELLAALAEQPAPSQYGSPELQAMIVARAMEKNAAAQPAQPQEPVALGALAKRRIFDYIRGAHDLGYNDARNARAIPGDGAPGYKGRDVEADHGSALLHALEAITSPPAQRKPLTLGQKQRLWSSVGDKPTLKDRVNAYGLAIEAAHGITKGNT